MDYQPKAIQFYEEQNDINVQSCRFVVNHKWHWLGASHDGIVKIHGIKKAIKVKCPHSNKDLTIIYGFIFLSQRR